VQFYFTQIVKVIHSNHYCFCLSKKLTKTHWDSFARGVKPRALGTTPFPFTIQKKIPVLLIEVLIAQQVNIKGLVQ